MKRKTSRRDVAVSRITRVGYLKDSLKSDLVVPPGRLGLLDVERLYQKRDLL